MQRMDEPSSVKMGIHSWRDPKSSLPQQLQHSEYAQKVAAELAEIGT